METKFKIEVNVGDFLKSILNKGDFLRKSKCCNPVINVGHLSELGK